MQSCAAMMILYSVKDWNTCSRVFGRRSQFCDTSFIPSYFTELEMMRIDILCLELRGIGYSGDQDEGNSNITTLDIAEFRSIAIDERQQREKNLSREKIHLKFTIIYWVRLNDWLVAHEKRSKCAS